MANKTARSFSDEQRLESTLMHGGGIGGCRSCRSRRRAARARTDEEARGTRPAAVAARPAAR